jgi:malate dehydrogenase (oxaloacetate-decarboxylating)(NADP+)
VLCFPFMFRGALDVGATTINEEMKVAAVRAIAELAHAEQSEVVTAAYGTEDLAFGPEYLIPKPFDPRLILKVAPAVARRRWIPASPRGRSRTWSATATSSTISSITPAC